MQHTPAFLQLVTDAKTRISEISIEEVWNNHQSGKYFTLIDVREESEYALNRLPGAIHLGKGIIERDIETRFPNMDEPLILYCGGGYRSALAADNLQKMGYTRVWSMQGGYRGWTEANLPLETQDDTLAERDG